jgi:hypothetical protein
MAAELNQTVDANDMEIHESSGGEKTPTKFTCKATFS